MTKAAIPSRSLTDRKKPHRYVPAAHTDIRRTFKKFSRFINLQERANVQR